MLSRDMPGSLEGRAMWKLIHVLHNLRQSTTEDHRYEGGHDNYTVILTDSRI
jgi:hypothetical protein